MARHRERHREARRLAQAHARGCERIEGWLVSWLVVGWLAGRPLDALTLSGRKSGRPLAEFTGLLGCQAHIATANSRASGGVPGCATNGWAASPEPRCQGRWVGVSPPILAC